MNRHNEIPESWIVSTLSEIGKIISGGTPSTSVPENWGEEVNWISPVDLSGYKSKYIIKGGKSISKTGLENSSAKLMPKGSVLFSSRAPIGYVAIAGEELCTNQGFKSVIPSPFVFNEYLYYYLKAAKKLAEELASGTTFMEISLGNFGKIPFPLPPLAEQHRIVAKIEELFSSLDKGVETLKTAQQQLKVYRQAVLKWAFEGRLTHPDLKEGELPEGWEVVTFKDASELIGDGLHGTPQYSDGEYYFINGNNLCYGKIEIKSGTKKVGISEYKKHYKPLGNNTVLVSINGTIGNVAFYNNEPVILGKSACFINLKETYSKYYITYIIESTSFINYAIKNATGSTIKNVGLKAIREFKFACPKELEEQNNIVQEIESRLSVCDKIEESIEQGLQQAEALRQSILKKAFEGKLVPQDPNDEPASVLLERIKAERVSGKSAMKESVRKGRMQKA